MNEPNRPDMVKLTEEKIQKLKESVSDLPPFTGDMGEDGPRIWVIQETIAMCLLPTILQPCRRSMIDCFPESKCS